MNDDAKPFVYLENCQCSECRKLRKEQVPNKLRKPSQDKARDK